MKKLSLIISVFAFIALLTFILPQTVYGQCSCDNPDGACTKKVCAKASNCGGCVSPAFCVDNLDWDSDEECCCTYQSSHCELSDLCGSSGTPVPSTPKPGTVAGRVYCTNPNSSANNYNVIGAPIRVINSGGNTIKSTTSGDEWGTSANNYSVTFSMSSSSKKFSVRSGTDGGNGNYSPVNQQNFCTSAHESCSYSSVEGTTKGGFNFFTDIITPAGTEVCSIAGDSVTFSWDNISDGVAYNLRVNNRKDGWFTKGSDYFWVVPNHPSSSCTSSTCTATITTSSSPALEVGQSYDWTVQPIDSDDGQHCQGPRRIFSCACNLPDTPTNLSVTAPVCSDTPTSVTLNWDDMSGATSYVLEIDGDTHTILDSSCSGGRCSFDFTATPLQGYAWTVYAENSCGQSTNAVATFNMDACAVAWMQTKDADLITHGNINSWIPSGKYLIDNNSGNDPGIAIFGDIATHPNSPNTHNGDISAQNWSAGTDYSQIPVNRYSFAYFNSLAPRKISSGNYVHDWVVGDVNSGVLNGPNFFTNNCDKDIYEYCWFRYDGDILGDPLIITKNELFNSGYKVILLVENADLQFGIGGLTAERKIVVNEGNDFFMTIVEGDINVLKEFQHSIEIELEGIYFTDGVFTTEAGTEQLHLKGMLAAIGGINLNRDLGLDNNKTEPSEKFEYAPELLFHFPAIFTNRRTIWREVNP